MPIARPPAPANSSTLRIEKSPYSQTYTRRFTQLAFPNRQRLPPLARKLPFISFVPSLVSFELWLPKIQTGFRHPGESAASVTVPEAAMHENNLAPRSENEVGAARQILLVKPVAIAQREDQSADQHLGARVPGSHARHDLRPFSARDRVHKRFMFLSDCRTNGCPFPTCWSAVYPVALHQDTPRLCIKQ